MERLWLTDCAYLLTKPDHWFCPQRCAVLDGETRQGLPAEERAGCIPLPYVEIETLHRAFFDRKADGLLRRQYLRILRTSADRDAAIDAVGRMLEERNLTGEYAAFERQFLLDAAQVWCRENGIPYSTKPRDRWDAAQAEEEFRACMRWLERVRQQKRERVKQSHRRGKEKQR